jgi:hypothetical protein
MGKAGKKLKRLLRDINEGLYGSDYLPCPACASGDHLLCENGTDGHCCCPVVEFENVEGDESDAKRLSYGDATKTPDAITDVQSTGRKRAKVMYPITEDMECEWRGLGRAGGGVNPIIGCIENRATDRHHGPDKNTLNNKAGNVHRICSPCHNLWHARNDEFYGERPPGTEPFIPLDGHEWCQHDSETKAPLDELIKAQLGRKIPKKKVEPNA